MSHNWSAKVTSKRQTIDPQALEVLKLDKEKEMSNVLTPEAFIKLIDEDRHESGVIIKYRVSQQGDILQMSGYKWRSEVLVLVMKSGLYRDAEFVAPNTLDDWTFYCYRIRPETGEECENCNATENLGWANEDGAFKLCIGGCMPEYEIGSQWKTRGGWRAVVVEIPERGRTFKAWHTGPNGSTAEHRLADGQLCNYAEESDEDLIEPWTEPRSGVFWYNVYETARGDITSSRCLSRSAADEMRGNRIACIRMPWTEGEGWGDV